MTEARPANVTAGIPREVHAPHAPEHLMSSQESKVSAVEGHVTMIAEHEELTFRDEERPPIIARCDIVCGVAARIAHEVRPLPAKFVRGWIQAVRRERIGLMQRVAVYPDHTILHRDRVAGQADHALHEGFRWVVGELMQDDLAASNESRVRRDAG